jgi:hypothetical protein
MTVLYPLGYKKQLVTIERLIELHSPDMIPEYRRRIFPWIVSKGGLVGIGDGWRPCPSDVSEASKRCESFHQDQRFKSGRVGYCAVDLVARNGTKDHRSPTWAETEDAPAYGLHTFIGKDTPTPKDDEAWHLQPIEIRGWASWVTAGRPDLKFFPLPDSPEDDMPPIAMRPKGFLNVFIVQAANAIHASPEMMNAYGLKASGIIDFDHPQTLKSLLFKSGTDLSDLVKA